MRSNASTTRAVAVTGASGFIGGRLLADLAGDPHLAVLPVTRAGGVAALATAVARADVIAHLAGVTRPPTADEFERGNRQLTETLAAAVEAAGRAPLIIFASSVRATQDTDYGRTKRAAEDILLRLGMRTGARIAIFRLPQVFGRSARPHYNAISATVLADAAAGKATPINRPGDLLELVDVADVVRAMRQTIAAPPASSGLVAVAPVFRATVGDVAAVAARFGSGGEPATPLERALFDAFLGYREALSLGSSPRTP